MSAGTGNNRNAHFNCNPCCCIPLRPGVAFLCVTDMLLGVISILRVFHLKYLKARYPEFYPEHFPNPTDVKFMECMFHMGNFIVEIISAVFLLIATQYFKNSLAWLCTSCFFWMAVRLVLLTSLSVFCNALINTGTSHFIRFGVELLFCVFLHVYYIVVVAAFLREARNELHNYRAIKPLNIDMKQQESFLPGDGVDIFNNAAAYNMITPQFFLGLKTHDEKELLTDETLLQYVVPKTRVSVRSERRSQKLHESKVHLEVPTSSSATDLS